jgi:hypothetical protein
MVDGGWWRRRIGEQVKEGTNDQVGKLTSRKAERERETDRN